MPATQTPTEGSADAKATLLFALHNGKESAVPTGRPYQINLKFEHMAAYAKLTLRNVGLYKEGDKLPEGSVYETMPFNETVEKVTITNNEADKPLAGKYSYNYQSRTATVTSNTSQSITLDVSKLDITAEKTKKTGDNQGGYPIYFATAPVTLTDFTITITTNTGRTFTKDINKSLALNEIGKVMPFSVNFDGIEDPEKTLARVYDKVKNPYVIGAREFILVTIPNSINTFYNNNNGENNVTKSIDILNDEKFDVDDKSSPDSIYYIGEESNDGKAVDFTWTFEDANLDTWTGVGSAGIKSANSTYAADKAMYLSINSGSPVLSNTKAIWNLTSASQTDGTLYLTYNNQRLDLSDTGLKAASASYVKSQYFYFFVDAGLKFVKFESKATETPEEDVTYKKVTTKSLPTGKTDNLGNATWTDLIMTVTKGTGVNAKTYLVRNVNSDGNLSGTPMLDPISEDMLSTTDGATYITVKPKKYTWLTVLYSAFSGEGYVFNSASKAAANTYLCVNSGSPELSASYTQYSATLTDNGNYTLRRVTTSSTQYYLSVDDSGKFIATTSQPTDVYFQFYGEQSIVEDKEKEENTTNTTSTYTKVTTVTNGKEYVMTSTYMFSEYFLGNSDASVVKVVDSGLTKSGTSYTGDGSKCSFTAVQGSSGFYFVSTSNNNKLYCTTSSVSLSGIMYTEFTYNGTQLFSSSGYYLYTNSSIWGFSNGAAVKNYALTLYEKQ